MLSSVFVFLLENIVQAFVLAALLRFYAQLFRAPFRNPITDFIVALTNFAVKPLRRIVPGFMGLDIASFLTAWLAEFLLLVMLYALLAPAIMTHSLSWPGLVLLAFLKLLRLSIYLLIGVLIIQALLSWVNP